MSDDPSLEDESFDISEIEGTSEGQAIFRCDGERFPDDAEVKVKKFGICGTGTKLIEGVCTVIEKPNMKPWWQFW